MVQNLHESYGSSDEIQKSRKPSHDVISNAILIGCCQDSHTFVSEKSLIYGSFWYRRVFCQLFIVVCVYSSALCRPCFNPAYFISKRSTEESQSLERIIIYFGCKKFLFKSNNFFYFFKTSLHRISRKFQVVN